VTDLVLGLELGASRRSVAAACRPFTTQLIDRRSSFNKGVAHKKSEDFAAINFYYYFFNFRQLNGFSSPNNIHKQQKQIDTINNSHKLSKRQARNKLNGKITRFSNIKINSVGSGFTTTNGGQAAHSHKRLAKAESSMNSC